MWDNRSASVTNPSRFFIGENDPFLSMCLSNDEKMKKIICFFIESQKSSLQERKKYNMITDKVKLRLYFRGYFYLIYPTDYRAYEKTKPVKVEYNAMWKEIKIIAENSCCFAKTE